MSLSTPETIHRDLQGTRAELEVHMPDARSGSVQPPDIVRIPEVTMLGKIGRRDLLLGWEAKPKHG